MVALNKLMENTPIRFLLADGFLVDGTSRKYIQRMPITKVSVNPYNKPEQHRAQIRVHSYLSGRLNVSYLLVSPLDTYERFFTPFLWVANLAKYLMQVYSYQIICRWVNGD